MTPETTKPGPVPSFAEIAVEIRVGQLSIAEMSFAAAILCMIRTDNLYRLERIAIDCGIESQVARDIILDEKRLSALIAEGHRLFKAMIPHEAAIRRLIASNNDGVQQ